MSYQAATAAELLGVKPKNTETTLTLAYSVEKGLPVSALDKFAKVFAVGLEVFRDEAKVRSFLERPHPMLDDKPPLEVALATGPGADAVINLIGRAAYSGGV
jgi:uncharacterized protein (DUF2384 family)